LRSAASQRKTSRKPETCSVYDALRGCGVAAHAVDQQGEEAVGERIRVAARLQPGIGPVGRGQEEQGSRGHVQVRPQLRELDSFLEQAADPLLVAPAGGDELLPPLA